MDDVRAEAALANAARMRAELTFRMLELALDEGGARNRPVPVIQFVVDGAPWIFDPGARGDLFAPGQHPRPVLTLRLGLDLLVRLLVDDDFCVEPGDTLSTSGDLDALDALAACFRDPENTISIRTLRGTP